MFLHVLWNGLSCCIPPAEAHYKDEEIMTIAKDFYQNHKHTMTKTERKASKNYFSKTVHNRTPHIIYPLYN